MELAPRRVIVEAGKVTGLELGYMALDASGNLKPTGETTLIAALPLASNADSTGLDLLTGLFNLAAGSQTFTLTAAEANIVHVSMDDEAEKTAHLRFVLQVRNRVHLAQLMRQLRRLPEVTRLSRT